MLKKYPNITNLYGHNFYTLFLIIGCFGAQTALALYAANGMQVVKRLLINLLFL